MDYRKSLCKCNKCNKLFIDTIPNTNCLRYHEDEIPKRIKPLTEDGCPICGSWDELDDVFDEILLRADGFKNALEVGKKQYPNAIFFKALTGGDAGKKALGKYLFIQ